MNKATLILPCSAAKLTQRAPAIELYQGKGYLGIVRCFDLDKLKEKFNIFFMSALHGLIPAFCVLEPYEQQMNSSRFKELLADNDLKLAAQDIAKSFSNTKNCYIVLPKAYKKILNSYIGEQLSNLDVLESSGGIGTQRGMLKTLINYEFSTITYRPFSV